MKTKQITYEMKVIIRICIALLIACVILIALGNTYQTKAEAASDEPEYQLVITPVQTKTNPINDKYWYIFQNTNLSYDVVQYIDDMCCQYNVNPHIMMAIYHVESNFTINADNTNSSARGLGQVLSSTGKYVYEVLLDKGTYVHTMAYDPYVNVQISVKLIQYYLQQKDGNLNLTLQKYSGTKTSTYYNKVVSFLADYNIPVTSPYYT